uniref:Isoleucine N-monooxygenase 2-like n=1 Tax=Nicotiana tabacum TaxID=4097 RepID=A0A1S3X4N0_TOBAC|nr:PREDICTED: isoleucine N-monooxygenase 2-like [Nicotiana tabacum]
MVSTFFSYITTLWQIFFSIILKITSKLLGTTRNKPLLPPGPKPWPVFGCIPQMVLNKKPAFEWIHKLMEEMNTEIACIRLGNVHVIPVTSPELACLFLKNQDSIFSSSPICMYANLVSNGCLTSLFLPMGDQWMKMRRILPSHVLSATSFQWLPRKRDEEADHIIRFVYDQCINKRLVINLRKVTRYYCANVINNMIFSKRLLGKRIIENGGPLVELQQDQEKQIDAIFTLLEYFHSFSISDYLPWLSRFYLDGHKAIIKKAFPIATKHIDLEIDQRIHIWKHGNKNVEEDILDVLIMLRDSNGNTMLNAKEIKAQVLEFMLAMLDNPSYAFQWTIKEMLNQPMIMQRAIEEIDNVIGGKKFVQESDLPQLNYVKACIKGSFRLHPLAAFNAPHVSVSNSVVGEYFIIKNVRILNSCHYYSSSTLRNRAVNMGWVGLAQLGLRGL